MKWGYLLGAGSTDGSGVMSNGGVEGRGGKVGVTSDRGVSLPGKMSEGEGEKERGWEKMRKKKIESTVRMEEGRLEW